MSDTPETEANIWSDSCEGILCKVVSAEFARRLERERDEARINAERSKAYKKVLKVTNENLKRERDEAREAFVIATDQMVIAQGKVREANKERDEAREEVRLLKAILELIKKDTI